MSYQEKNIAVSLSSHALILGLFVTALLRMNQEGSLNPQDIFRLWAVVIILAILVNIFASILTQIVLGIIDGIRTHEEPSFIEDERDKMIELKGTRNTYYVFSLGVLFSMLTFVFNQPPLVMFTLLVFFSIVAQIFGDISQLVMYRRGV